MNHQPELAPSSLAGPPPSMLGAPPASALGPAAPGLLWYGLSGAPKVPVSWGRPMPAGSDAGYSYSRVVGTGGGRMYLFVQATPIVRGPPLRGRLAPVGYFYVAAPPKVRAAGGGFLGQPPIAYEGAPDRPYPPSGPGWFETTWEDQTARAAAVGMLGELPINSYADRLLPTGLYRLFAFEGASGATQIGALRYWGDGSASTLGAEPSFPLPNPNSNPAIAAAQAFLTWLSANGCPAQGTYVPEVFAMQSAYNATGIGPAITPNGDYGPNSEAALQLVLNSVNPPAGTAPPNCYGTPAPATPGTNPTPGLVVPTVVVAAKDAYDTLTAAQQSAFRQALFASVKQASCPAVDLSSVTSADSLNDSSNRAIAVDCFQSVHHVGQYAGVLDMATYQAVMSQAKASGVSGAAIAAVSAVALTAAAITAAAASGINPFKFLRM